MMARTLSSWSAASKAAINSCCICPVKALSLSGRFRVMVRICSETSYLIVSYAMGVSFGFFLILQLNEDGHAWSCAKRPHSLNWKKEDVDGRVKPGHDSIGSGRLLLRRRGPRLLRPAQALECLGHAEHADVVKTAADDLHADRKTVLVVAAVD